MRFYHLQKMEKEAAMEDKTSAEEISLSKQPEKGFKLPLPATIEGINKLGTAFKEKTTLSYISHQGCSFWLMNDVAIGNELKLNIDLPPSLSEEKNLKLKIKGKVVFIEATNSKDFRQRVSLRFENQYIIRAEE